jgi:hypothetical protein
VLSPVLLAARAGAQFLGASFGAIYAWRIPVVAEDEKAA